MRVRITKVVGMRIKMYRDERGQSLTEFALLLPLLLLLMCGIIDFGRMMYTYMNMNQAAQEAVRLGGLGKGDAEISEFAHNYVYMGDSSQFTVTISPSETQRESGDYVTVTLKWPFEFVTPFASNVLPSNYIVETDSTIRVE